MRVLREFFGNPSVFQAVFPKNSRRTPEELPKPLRSRPEETTKQIRTKYEVVPKKHRSRDEPVPKDFAGLLPDREIDLFGYI